MRRLPLYAFVRAERSRLLDAQTELQKIKDELACLKVKAKDIERRINAARSTFYQLHESGLTHDIAGQATVQSSLCVGLCFNLAFKLPGD